MLRHKRCSKGGPAALASAHLHQRSPRVRKQATEWRARWCIQPCCRSCAMMASILRARGAQQGAGAEQPRAALTSLGCIQWLTSMTAHPKCQVLCLLC
jgi:hypothetical protein